MATLASRPAEITAVVGVVDMSWRYGSLEFVGVGRLAKELREIVAVLGVPRDGYEHVEKVMRDSEKEQQAGVTDRQGLAIEHSGEAKRARLVAGFR